MNQPAQIQGELFGETSAEKQKGMTVKAQTPDPHIKNSPPPEWLKKVPQIPVDVYQEQLRRRHLN